MKKRNPVRHSKQNDWIDRVNYLFRNYPLVTPIFLIVSVIIVALAYVGEGELGYVFIVISSLFYIYVVVRYVIIGYRIFSKSTGTGPRTGILAVIDLKLVEYLCIAGLITGLYFIDTTPNKDRFMSHPEFSGTAPPFKAWAYILSVTIFVVSSTGFASIIEAHLITALIFAMGVIVAQISNLVIVSSVVAYLAEAVQEFVQSKRRKGKKPQRETLGVNS